MYHKRVYRQATMLRYYSFTNRKVKIGKQKATANRNKVGTSKLCKILGAKLTNSTPTLIRKRELSTYVVYLSMLAFIYLRA